MRVRSRRRGLLAILSLALFLGAGGVRAQTDPALEAEKARLEQERIKLEADRKALDEKAKQDAAAIEADRKRLAEEQSKSLADLDAKRKIQEQEQLDREKKLSEQKDLDAKQLEAERTKLADERKAQNAEFDKLQATLEEQQKQQQADFEKRQKELADDQAKQTEELTKKTEELAAQQRAFEERQAKAAKEEAEKKKAEEEAAKKKAEEEAAKKKEEETKKSGDPKDGKDKPPPKELPPLAPDPKPPRRVIEINAATVLGGELSALWGAFQAKHPELGLDAMGHVTKMGAGTKMVGGSRIDTLPSEWVAELLAIAKEQGLTGDNPDADFLVAGPGGAGGVIAQESARFQRESQARSESETARRDVERENASTSGSGGPTAVAEGKPAAPASSGSENVPNLDGNKPAAPNDSKPPASGNSGSGSSGNTDVAADGSVRPSDPKPAPPAPPNSSPSNSPSNSPSDTTKPAEGNSSTATKPSDGITPSDLAKRNIKLDRALTPDQKATVDQALNFVPQGTLKGGDGKGVSLVFEDANNPANPRAAAQWQFNPSNPPPKIRVFPLHLQIPDPTHALVHEMVHQGLESTSKGAVDRLKKALNALSDAEKQNAYPSQYSVSDPTGGHEFAAEAVSYYLENKNNEFNGRPYRETVPASLKAVIEEVIASWG
jgi:hypothetical protein